MTLDRFFPVKKKDNTSDTSKKIDADIRGNIYNLLEIENKSANLEPENNIIDEQLVLHILRQVLEQTYDLNQKNLSNIYTSQLETLYLC